MQARWSQDPEVPVEPRRDPEGLHTGGVTEKPPKTADLLLDQTRLRGFNEVFADSRNQPVTQITSG